jgi:SAM-dependent methyltransferase
MSAEGSSEEFRIDELESVHFCPACNQVCESHQYKDAQDLLEGVAGRWGFRACASCGCLFLDPRPKIESIGKAYRHYYTHHSGVSSYTSDNGASILWRMANGYLNYRYGSRRAPAIKAGQMLMPLIFPLRQQLDYFYRHLPNYPGRLLDVGCGNGIFLRRARDAGWNASGLDPDPLAVNAAQEDGLSVYLGTLDDFHSEFPFDVVSASHVIEHIHYPGLFLRQIRKLLCTNGMIWLATPNVQSLGHKVFGKAWRGLEPPRHLTLFTEKALRDLLKEAGFTDIRFLRRGRGAAYIIKSSRELASLGGVQTKTILPVLIDLWASLSSTGGEELVVTARKSCEQISK